jgi:hypothetical protein
MSSAGTDPLKRTRAASKPASKPAAVSQQLSASQPAAVSQPGDINNDSASSYYYASSGSEEEAVQSDGLTEEPAEMYPREPPPSDGTVCVLIEETCGRGSWIELRIKPTETELFLWDLQEQHAIFRPGCNTRGGADWQRFWVSYLMHQYVKKLPREEKLKLKWRTGLVRNHVYYSRQIRSKFHLGESAPEDLVCTWRIRKALDARRQRIWHRNQWHLEVDFLDYAHPVQQELSMVLEHITCVANGDYPSGTNKDLIKQLEKDFVPLERIIGRARALTPAMFGNPQEPAK